MSDEQQTPPTSMPVPEDQVIDNLQNKAQEHFANWQRAVADYQNLKKQSEKEKQEIAAYAMSQAALLFTPVYDNVKRAVKHIPADQLELEWVKGIAHIVKQFEESMKLLNITVIPTIGQPFDHAKHHAISKVKKDGVVPDTIIEEVKTGFMSGDRVLEPAQVVVAE